MESLTANNPSSVAIPASKLVMDLKEGQVSCKLSSPKSLKYASIYIAILNKGDAI